MFILVFNLYGQEYTPLKNWKCFKEMPVNVENIKTNDTLFVIYQKSDIKGFQQRKIYNRLAEDYEYYLFGKYFSFPIQIFDYVNWKRVNYREPKILYKNKKYICRNMYRTVDVKFLVNWGMKLEATKVDSIVHFFIVEIDNSIGEFYKIVQVNRPIYTED